VTFRSAGVIVAIVFVIFLLAVTIVVLFTLRWRFNHKKRKHAYDIMPWHHSKSFLLKPGWEKREMYRKYWLIRNGKAEDERELSSLQDIISNQLKGQNFTVKGYIFINSQFLQILDAFAVDSPSQSRAFNDTHKKIALRHERYANLFKKDDWKTSPEALQREKVNEYVKKLVSKFKWNSNSGEEQQNSVTKPTIPISPHLSSAPCYSCRSWDIRISD